MVIDVLDDNLLACPRAHVESVFAMLRRENRRIEFTGGLEALSLQDYQVELLASLRPRPTMFFAYDPGDEFETLRSAASRLLDAGFTRAPHCLRAYVLIGYPKGTFKTVTHEKLIDRKKKLIPTCIAEWISDQAKEEIAKYKADDENRVLEMISLNLKISNPDIATAMGWKLHNGEPDRKKAQRCVKILIKDKLIKETRTGRYQITPKGKKALKGETEEEDQEAARHPADALAGVRLRRRHEAVPGRRGCRSHPLIFLIFRTR